MAQTVFNGPEMLSMLGLRQLTLLAAIAVIRALVLILSDGTRDRDASAAKIQEDAEWIVETAVSRQGMVHRFGSAASATPRAH